MPMCNGRTVAALACSLASLFVASLVMAGPPVWERIATLEVPAGSTLRDFLLVSDTEMYAAIRPGGIRHSIDRGLTWKDVTGPLAQLSPESLGRASDGTILVAAAGPDGGIFRRMQGEWIKGKDSPTGGSKMAVLSDGTILSYGGVFKSAMCTIYRSSDHGATWVKGAVVNRGIGQVFQKAPNGDLWIGAEASGPYRSVDNGATWESMESKGAVNGATFFFAKDGGVVYAAHSALHRWTAAKPVFVSMASGGGQAAPGLPYDRQVFSSVTAPDGTIYLGTGKAYIGVKSYVYVSKDNGQTFALAPWPDLPSTHRVTLLRLDSTGVLYAGLRDGGLWRTSAPVAPGGPR
jgi:hypothetical protein